MTLADQMGRIARDILDASKYYIRDPADVPSPLHYDSLLRTIKSFRAETVGFDWVHYYERMGG